MARSVDEWIGKTDDAKVPERVRLRIFRRESGVCHLSGRKIMPTDKWQLDHKKALVEGGEHREGNLFPALVEPHKEKTKQEVKRRAKADAVAKRHLGIKDAPVRRIKSAPFFKPDRRPSKIGAKVRIQKPPLLPRRGFE